MLVRTWYSRLIEPPLPDASLVAASVSHTAQDDTTGTDSYAIRVQSRAINTYGPIFACLKKNVGIVPCINTSIGDNASIDQDSRADGSGNHIAIQDLETSTRRNIDLCLYQAYVTTIWYHSRL